MVRAQKTWYSTAGVRFMALGTDRKLYVYSEGVVSDITPIRLSATLSGPFTANGTATITVAHTNHGATEGDFVTYSGATALNGADFNAEYEITQVRRCKLLHYYTYRERKLWHRWWNSNRKVSIKCRVSYQ